MGKRSKDTVAAEVFQVEGFDVRFITQDDDVPPYVDPYKYERAAPSGWTVKRWRTTRWEPRYPDYDVEVLDSAGAPVHGKTLLSTVRASFFEDEEAPVLKRGSTSADTAFPVSQVSRRDAGPGSRSVKSAAEPLGFEGELWKAADKLRGSMDASEYKHVVLGLIFLKYIDDAFTERRQKLSVDLMAEGFEGAALHELLESRDEYTAQGVFWVPAEARWGHLRANAKQPTIGKLIDNAMDLVETDNPSLRGVLPKNFSRPALDTRRLGEIVDLISGIGLGSAEHREKDVLGRVYEYFLRRFASVEGKGGGEFYTPRSVVQLLVEMIEPYQGRVYDPCCGSGGMFVQSERFVEAHGGKRNDLSIFGEESNDTTWRMAKMNLAIRGIEADLGPRWGDTFHKDLHPDLKADFILANPPFNISDWGGEQLRDDARWKYGVPPVGNANFAWLEHIAAKLAPRGVAGVVLAKGALSSEQSGEGAIRRKLVDADIVECVVTLPRQLFFSTTIPVALWFLNRDKSPGPEARYRDRRGEVLFIDARSFGEMTDRTHREFSNEDISFITALFHAWRGEAGAGKYQDLVGICASASVGEIADRRYVLLPGRYVGTDDEDEEVVTVDSISTMKGDLLGTSRLIADNQSRFEDAVNGVILESSAGSLPEGWSVRPLSKLARFVNGKAFTKNATGTGRMVIRIAELNGGPGPSTVYNDIEVGEDHIARYGDLLFAWSGSLTVQRWSSDEAIINQHIFKVIPVPGVPPWFVHAQLLALLPSFRQIAADKATTMGHIQRHHLDVSVPVPNDRLMKRLGKICEPLWEWDIEMETARGKLQSLHDALLPVLATGSLLISSESRERTEVLGG